MHTHFNTSKPTSSVDPDSDQNTFIKVFQSHSKTPIEIRILNNDSRLMDRIWTRNRKKIRSFIKSHNGKHHIFFGAVTRTKNGGTKDHCREVPWLWADIDFKDYSGNEKKARASLNAYQYQPSILVNSGGGLHAYWLLDETIDAQTYRDQIEKALHGISKAVGGDSSRTDITSLLRLPGTINVKPEYDGPMCKIEFMELDRTYPLGAFLRDREEVIPSESWKTKGLVELKKAILQGNRDQGAFDYIRACVSQYRFRSDPNKLRKRTEKLLDEAGGEGLEEIKRKIPRWIEESINELKNGRKLSPLECAETVSQIYEKKIIHVNEQFRIYSNGYWQHLDDKILRKKITELDYPNSNSARTTSALRTLADLTSLPTPKDPTHDLICVKNGILNPLCGTLVPHKPIPRFYNQLPIKWDPTAKCALWKRTLGQIFKGDKDRKNKILLLQMFIGYCLIRDTSQAKFLWLVGRGANGKSLILEVLTSIIGVENTSRALLHRLDKPHVRAQLLHKLVNISSEMNADDTVSDSLLKAIVSGDRIEAELKFKPSFDFKPYARLIGSTNELPRLLDHSHGFERRAIILTFNRTFGESEQDKHLKSKLDRELPGILRWAVNGLIKLKERGNKGFIIPSSSKATLEEYRKNEDPVKQFVEDHLMKEEMGRLQTKEIYLRYANWVGEFGFSKMNVSTFGKRLVALNFQKRKTNGREVWRLKWKKPRNAAKGVSYDEPDCEDDDL